MSISTLVDIDKTSAKLLLCSKFNIIFLSLNSEFYSYFLTTGFQVCTRNGEESLNIGTSVQSFENYQLDTSSIEEGMYRFVCV